jgi:sulfonate transport system permease protein
MTANQEIISKPFLASAIPIKFIKRQDKIATGKSNRTSSTKDVAHYISFILPIGIIALWVAATHLGWIKPYFIPKPETIFSRFIEMVTKDKFLNDFWISFHIMLIGYVLGALFGLLNGISAGLSRFVDKFISPTINVFRQVPPIAWLPIFILFFGIGSTMKIVFLAMVVSIPIFLNTFQGIRSVSKEYLEVAQVFEYSSFQTLKKVVLPAAFPAIFTSLRFCLGAAWGMIVFVEMMNGKNGMGWVLNDSMELLDTPRTYVTIVVIGFVGFAFDCILSLVEKNLMSWKRQAL